MTAMTMTPTAVREAPRETLLAPAPGDPAFPNVGDPTKPKEFEEKLALDIIQGNVIDGGFNKDFQTALCLEIVDATRFKVWLKSQIDFIATGEEVLAFNRLFKKLRKKHGEPTRLKATWTNISFSFKGIELLVGNIEANRFLDGPFKSDLRAQSSGLGDPTDAGAEGSPQNWVIGGPGNEPHVIMIVASDDRADMLAEVARIEDTVLNFHVGGRHKPSGARIVFREEGTNLPRPLAGHEHFGTLDGISQPGVRGRASDDPHDVITPRQNPERVDNAIDQHRTQGKPGQDLLWPGEFVFGYPAQKPDATTLEDSKGHVKKAIASTAAHWTDNGSFLVFRRLRQDVFKFHTFLHGQAHTHLIDPLLLSSKLVGRWESGAPTVRNAQVDRPAMGDDDCANNDFEFNEDAGIPDTHHGPNDCADHFPEATFPKDDATDTGTLAGQATGKRCPFVAHTRKAYPRNDLTPEGTGSTRDERVDSSEVHTQTHRLMRRGIPFGPVSPSRPDEPIEDEVDRGLHFFAYQTSIDNQFEFVTRNWVNNPNFSTEAATGHECAGVLPLGHDPIIGQNGGTGGPGTRTRRFHVRFDEGGTNHCVQLTAPDDWVISTGGGYFFTPSIHALKTKLTS
jgi:Dyp-type peroxidase family